MRTKVKIASILLFIVAIACALVSCGKNKDHEHIKAYQQTLSWPTCTLDGEGAWYCSCEEQIETYVIPASGHSNFYEYVITDPTCASEGRKIVECGVCGMSETQAVPLIEHTYSYEYVTVDPTCTSNGEKIIECEVCYHQKTVSVEKIDHSLVIDEAVESTCSKTGLTEGKHCFECGTVIVEQQPTSMKEHIEATDSAVESTCTKTGLTEGKHCSECGIVLVEQKQTPMKEHTEVIDAAVESTCSEHGLTEGKHCSICNTVLLEQKETPKKLHTETIDAAVAATCSKTGLTEGKHCSVCKTVLVEQSVTPVIPHTYDNDTDNICNVCSYKRNCLHAVTETVAGYEPTCTKHGMTDGTRCSVCGEMLVAQTSIPVIDHTYTSKTTPPTCSERGYTTYTCYCGYSYVDDYVDTVAHEYTAVITPPTCDERGYTTYTCHCTYSYVGDYVDETGHNYGSSICEKCGHSSLAFELNLDGESYSVVGIGSCNESKVIIPTIYEGLLVTSIAPSAFKNCTALTSIVVPNSVTSIGSAAFGGCGSLESITLPFVGDCIKTSSDNNQYPFGYIFGTESYDGGAATVQYYHGDLPFETYYIPTSLKSVTINGGNILARAFFDCVNISSVILGDNVTSIGEYAFHKCTGLTDIEISDGVSIISDRAFNLCTGLTSIEIPKSVKSIGKYAFSGCNKLESVNIPDGVTFIDNFAFANCVKLTSIEIPDSLSKIGSSVFSGCSSLESVTLPFIGGYRIDSKNYHFGYIFGASTYSDNASFVPKSLKNVKITSVTKINDYAFYNCSAIANIEIPDGVISIGDYAFYKCDGITNIEIPDSVISIGDYAFYQCDAITNIEIPDSVTSISDKAFYGCNNLVSVTFGENSKLTSIGEYAFCYCEKLTSMVIPDSVTSIGIAAFRSCDNLESITLPFVGATKGDADNVYFGYIFGTSNGGKIPASLKTVVITSASISDKAFYNCDSIERIVIGDGVTSIGASAFESCDQLVSVTIGDGVTSIGASAFSSCEHLASVTIGCSVESIGDHAFYGCISLTDITVDSNNTAYKSIDGNLYKINEDGETLTLVQYASAKTDTSFTIPDSVTSISNYAFYRCSNLTSIEIPYSVTSIGDYAFYRCSNLTGIEIPYSVTSIGDYAFSYCSSLTSVVVSDGVTRIGLGAFHNCNNLESITLPFVGEAETETYNTNFGYIFGVGSNSKNSDYVPSSLKTVKITSAKNIPHGAFYDCGNIETIELPDCLTFIGDSAFYNCDGLTSIELPNSLISIGNSAFWECDGLTSIKLPGSLTSIGGNSFSSCDGLTSVEFSDGLTSIGSSMFVGCTNLTSVTIPDSVTSIDIYAFSNCSALTNVFITDIAAWCNINFASSTSNPLYYASKLYLKNGADSTLLTKISIPGSVTVIKPFAFAGYAGITSIGSAGSGASVEIPGSVKSIGAEAFLNCANLTSVDIPSSVTNIDASTFNGCSGLTEVEKGISYIDGWVIGCDTSLTSVVLRDGTVGIADKAFYSCTSLTSIEIPSSLRSIGASAFLGCSKLTSLYITDIAAWCNIDFKETFSNPIYYAKEVYLKSGEESELITELVIPDGVKEIKDYAFYYFKRITSVTIPSSVEKIGVCAFDYCNILSSVYISDVAAWCNIDFANCSSNPFYNASSLYLKSKEGSELVTEIVIPDGVTKINAYAFYSCNDITTVTIPSSVESIGTGAFLYCHDLVSVYITDIAAWCNIDFESESANPFYSAEWLYLKSGEKIERIFDITIPDGVTKIKDYSFYGFDYLFRVKIPNGVTGIGKYAFYMCDRLESITISNSVESIGESAFSRCDMLASVTIPDSVKSIGDYAFSDCDSLKSITVPGGVKIISEGVFAGCIGLTSVTLCDGVTSIENNVFYNCESLTSFIPSATLNEIGELAFEQCNEALFTKHGNATYLATPYNTHYALLCVNNKDLDSYSIHRNTVIIANRAFEKCGNVVEITMPDKVVSVGAAAFKNCTKLKTVAISSNMRHIGQGAFENAAIIFANFKNTLGWTAGEDYVSSSTLSDQSVAATLLKGDYCAYAWNCDVTQNPDSDYDGLPNSKELTLGTDPYKYDTDGDGASDGDEVYTGTDPLVYDEKFDVSAPPIIDNTGKEDIVTPIIEVELSGEQLNSLVIERLDVFDENDLGYLGGVYEYSVSGTFTSATIGFEFDTSMINSSSKPTIYSYDKLAGRMTPLETTVIGNRATANVTSFSAYVLRDRTVYEQEFKWVDVWGIDTGASTSVEIVFVIDDSGSMVDNDKNNVRLTVAQNLIDKIPDGCKIGIVKFTDSITKCTTALTTDKSVAKNYLTTSYFKSNGGTDIYGAVIDTISLFSSAKENDGVMRLMILLSDGEPNSTDNKNVAINSAARAGLTVHTIGLGSGSSNFTANLKPLSDSTNGKFYHSSNASSLGSVFDDISIKIDLTIDSDKDGLIDYYEDNMVMFNGYSYKTDKTKRDTDGDGLLDGQEIITIITFNEDKTQMSINGTVKSDPTKKDTDGDGYSDKTDNWPMDKNHH